MNNLKIVVYTQRVEIIEDYNERRDCIDRNIVKFIKTCGYLPVALPNEEEIAIKIIETLKPVGIILTGGNSLVKYGGDAPERDLTETRIIEYAITNNIALCGICRGMQMILDYFGNELMDIKNHVAIYHKIYDKNGEVLDEVNSYHNQGIKKVKYPLLAIAQAEDGVIEEVRHQDKKIIAIMWHPERQKKFQQSDINKIKELFG